MVEEKISAFVLQPHDTPFSEILSQHRKILTQVKQSLEGTLEKKLLYPFYPCHGIIDFNGSVQELKKQITSCKILPPTYEKGFFFRPIEILGATIRSFPQEIVYKVLPFLKERNCKQITVPKGFIFGYLKNHEDFEEQLIKDSIHQFNIPALNLRVFKLLKVQYSWTKDETTTQGEETSSPLYWTSQSPQWVKLH